MTDPFTSSSEGDPAPGPWFRATFECECSYGDDIEVWDVIRADGFGEWEHQDCVREFDQ